LTTNTFRNARRLRWGGLIILCACSLLACDSQSSDGNSTAGTGHFFDPEDKTLRKRACEFLTPDLVSGLFDVPAGELRQTKMMGCIYTWRKDGQVLDVKLMLIRVQKSVEGAATWFGNATASKSKKQLDAEMDVVKERVQESEELDTTVKKKTAADLTELAKRGSPDEGVSYDDVPGLADQAGVSNIDGAIWVRLGNMTFQVSAFKGPDQPKLKIDPKNLKGIAKASMDAQKKWVKDTLEQRKSDAMTLAPRVVEAISAAAAG
jgi:hypothetical protein